MAVTSDEQGVIRQYMQLSREMMELRARRGPLSERVECELAEGRYDLWVLLSKDAQLELETQIESLKQQYAAYEVRC